jgi:hypothetical protein
MVDISQFCSRTIYIVFEYSARADLVWITCIAMVY